MSPYLPYCLIGLSAAACPLAIYRADYVLAFLSAFSLTMWCIVAWQEHDIRKIQRRINELKKGRE